MKIGNSQLVFHERAQVENRPEVPKCAIKKINSLRRRRGSYLGKPAYLWAMPVHNVGIARVVDPQALVSPGEWRRRKW